MIVGDYPEYNHSHHGKLEKIAAVADPYSYRIHKSLNVVRIINLALLSLHDNLWAAKGQLSRDSI